MIGSFPVLRHSTYTRRGLVRSSDTTHTHTHSSLFHSIRIYCPRSTPYNKYKRARPRHAVNHSCMHAFIRRRDVARETGDDRATTTRENERTRASPTPSSSPTRRDRESFTRESSVSGKSENPLAERVNARGFIHSFIHSVRFGLT